MRACIFGGHYGSEGKGSLAEYLLKQRISQCRPAHTMTIVFGENSPNSGHTNSVGKTRNIPVSSFYADAVILGPDSAIDVDVLAVDLCNVNSYRALKSRKPLPVYIHENAALVCPRHKDDESRLVQAISSTGTGSGAARAEKYFSRLSKTVIGTAHKCAQVFGLPVGVTFLNTTQYLELLERLAPHDWLFECSQGTLLDTNFGIYPYVTSRSTLPRVAIERNSLSGFGKWEYYGLYRTYPIRTGGPSGPTGGAETSFAALGVPDEVATVTKRVRRIFDFNLEDFVTSVKLSRPNHVAFTHVDYLKVPSVAAPVQAWLQKVGVTPHMLRYLNVDTIMYSDKCGSFHQYMVHVPPAGEEPKLPDFEKYIRQAAVKA